MTFLSRLLRLPWWAVILLFLGLGAVASAILIVNDRRQTPPAGPAEALPPLPGPAAAIIGIESDFFHEAIPYVETAAGDVYAFTWEELGEVWIAATPPARPTPGRRCTPAQETALAGAAGSLQACRTIQTLGEFCPGPIVAVGIAADGDVWRWTRSLPCTGFFVLLGVAIIEPAALTCALLLLALRRLIRAARRARAGT